MDVAWALVHELYDGLESSVSGAHSAVIAGLASVHDQTVLLDAYVRFLNEPLLGEKCAVRY